MANGKVLKSMMGWACATRKDVLTRNMLDGMRVEVCTTRKECPLTKEDRKRYCRRVRVTVEEVK